MSHKKLRKEVLEINEANDIFSGGYIKEYDENADLIYWVEHDLYGSYASKLTYDQQRRTVNEEIEIRKSYGEPSEKREKRYEYYELGYRILEYQTQIIDDSSTAPQFKSGGLITPEEMSAEYPRDVNELLSIEDITLNKDGIVHSRKITNLLDNETELIEYEYVDGNLSKEVFFDIVKKEKKISKEIILEYGYETIIVFRSKKTYPVVTKKVITYQQQKDPVIDISKHLYSINKDKTITLNHDITDDQCKFDFEGNLIQKIMCFGERIIYVNDYLPPDNKLLKSVHEVMVYEDIEEPYKVMSKRYFYYFE
ncbi:hypothetical protein [Zobellia amurskyensis]|nr:hypothetical protein [Zobellia amurskyensis]